MPFDPSDESRPGCVFPYVRVSTEDQKLSIHAQVQSVRKYASQRLSLPTLSVGYDEENLEMEVHPGFFVDRAQSAFKLPLAKRPAGAKMLEYLKSGDCVVVHRLDRLSRSMSDFCDTIADFEKRGIGLISASQSFDMSTANGRLFARQIVNMAEWESDRKSERIKAALYQKRLRELEGDDSSNTPRDNTPSQPSEYRVPKKPEDSTEVPAGRLLIYIRISHRESAASGLGVAAQLHLAQIYVNRLIALYPNLTPHPTMFTDIGVSAFKNDFKDRTGGKHLISELQRGDHVIFASLDRGFRNICDMSTTWPIWEKMGVDMHFVTEDIRMSDPVGRMMGYTMVQFAEMESYLTSERNRECRAVLAEQGRWGGGFDEPVFWNVHHMTGGKRLVLDRDRIAQFRLLRIYTKFWIREEIGPKRGNVRPKGALTVEKALVRLEEILAKREQRRPIPANGAMPTTTICRSYFAALKAGLIKSPSRTVNQMLMPFWTHISFYKNTPHYHLARQAWNEVAARRRANRQYILEEETSRFCGDFQAEDEIMDLQCQES